MTTREAPVKTTWMQLIAVLMVALLISGCGAMVQTPAAHKYNLPGYAPDPLPLPIEDRPDTKLPPKAGAPKDLRQGETAPFNGVLIDGYLAAKYKLVMAERDRLRSQIDIDRRAYDKTHAITNGAFQDMAQRAERSWWENNKGTVGFWVGTAVGLGLAVLTVFAIDRTTK
jgi:hypothetical protein